MYKKSRLIISLVTISWLSFCAVCSHAAPTIFQSGSQQVQLIELYTSEGCSSCPPADKHISALLTDQNLWKTRIPIAFHVDYWDYVGWKDPFAKPEHSQRQRLHQRLGNTRSVYTPGFVIDGREWTGFFNGAAWPRQKSNEPGDLQIVYDKGHVDVTYIPADLPGNKKPRALELQLAWLGMGLDSEVKRGENSGLTLPHNFVVLRSTGSLLRAEDNYHASLILDSNNLPKAERYAVVAWLEDTMSRKPVQAVGGWISLD